MVARPHEPSFAWQAHVAVASQPFSFGVPVLVKLTECRAASVPPTLHPPSEARSRRRCRGRRAGSTSGVPGFLCSSGEQSFHDTGEHCHALLTGQTTDTGKLYQQSERLHWDRAGVLEFVFDIFPVWRQQVWKMKPRIRKYEVRRDNKNLKLQETPLWP